MFRLYLAGVGCVVMVLPLLALQPDDAADLKQALALQNVVQKTIDDAESAIACVVVSRSEFYQKYGYDYSPYAPGQLGGYDPKRVDDFLQKKGLPREKRDEITRQLDLADADHVPESFGSGVVIDSKGLVLTNYHVVAGATKVLVHVPGAKPAYADILAADPRSDLAVLQLDRPGQLKALPLGKGEDARRGQFVVAVANPFVAGANEPQPRASFGIISNVRRNAPRSATIKEWKKASHYHATLLQTDVPLQQGASGGALLSLDGKLIALTTTQAAVPGLDQPGGFAVPLDATTRQVVDILRKGEDVEYAFLGVSFTNAKKPARGVLLSNVLDGSPADLQGLRTGDQILAVNDQPVKTADDMYFALGGLFAGADARLEVRKSGKQAAEVVTVRLAKSHVAGKCIAAHSRRPFYRGFRADYTSLCVQCKFPGYNYETIPRGVLVTDVQPNSPAATALLKPGEVITHVNGQAVDTPGQFYQRVLKLNGPVELTLISLNGELAPKIPIN